jgi:putative ABC transport system permease protein
LVVFQFVISTVLIYSTFIIIKQLNFLRDERLGFDKEQVLIVPVRDQSDQFKVSLLKEEFLRVPGVRQASAVSGVPGINEGIHDFQVVPEDNPADTLQLLTLTVDHDYAETLGLTVLSGRDFSEEYATDYSQAFVINETAAKKLGWNDPVGKELTMTFYMQGRVEKKGKVIGVVKDFQYHSLHKSIDPVLIHVFPASYYNDYLVLRLEGADLQGTLAALKAGWESFNPSRPFEYSFLDEKIDAMYRAEQRLSRIFSAFSILTVFVACLGLFGLASYSTEQRTKEIGVRKVLGATTTDILRLLSKDFMKLVVAGFLLAVPLVLYFMDRWLQNFAEQVDLGFGMFLLVGLVAFTVAMVAVSLQSVRAATMNPVDSLRSE